jgi:two-component system, OmpR family, sensor histidine kinase MprB
VIVRASCARWEKRSQRPVQLSVAVRSPDDGLFVLIAPTALQRIIDNLLSNAVKFSPNESPSDSPIKSPSKSPIDVHVQRAANVEGASMVSLRIRDHGPGIADTDLAHVFDRFYRSDLARAITGSGLGLAIVKELVERANGTVAASNANDHGAIFEVQFPLLPTLKDETGPRPGASTKGKHP